MVYVCGMIALQKEHAQWWPEGGLCSGVAFIMLLRWEREEEVQKVFNYSYITVIQQEVNLKRL